jgi:hypothetical protein
MAFSATQAAFEGFRIARERPFAVLAWAILQLITNLVSTSTLIWFAGPELNRFSDPMNLPPPGDAQATQAMMATVLKLLPAYGVASLVVLVMYAILSASVYRVVLRPSDRGFAGLKLSGDELRQIGVLLGLFLVFTAVYFGLGILLGMVAGVLGMILPAVGFLVGLVGVLGMIGVMLWILVKFSLAGPLSFDTQRVDLFGSWRMTKGHFWPLLGAYLFAWCLAFVVVVLFMVIYGAIASVATGSLSVAMGALKPDYTSFQTFFTPLHVFYFAFMGLVSGLTTAIVSGVGARVYSELKGPGAAVF